MKSTFTFLTLLFTFFWLTDGLAQCSTTPCPLPMQTNDPKLACILPGPQALNCHEGSTNNQPIIAQPPSWCTTIENNHWYAFVATGPTATFEIECTGCASGQGIQAAVFETTDCVNFNFVSPCYGGINVGSTTTVVGSGLTPGQVYYLMIDGQAGAICDYSINGSSNTVTGFPTNICIPSSSTGFYSATELSQWVIQPPSAGVILGSPVANDVNVQWTGAGTAQICATSLECPGAPPMCIPITIGNDVMSTEEAEVCIGGAVVCGGQTFFTAGVYPITYQTWNGCDSNITCIITPIPPVFVGPIQADICAPDYYEICGNFYVESGIYTNTCVNWQGCDSTVTVDLAVMNPMPVIAPPDELGCTAGSTIILDGTASNFNDAVDGNTTFFWYGPGIIGPDDGTTITVDQPGEYCLELTHERNGVFCTETVCVTVDQNVEFPDPPSLTGDTEVCDGDIENYTVTPNGPVVPTGFIWTTPNGEPFTQINNTTISIDWTGSFGGDLCVTAENDCGESDPTCIFITVNAGPETPILDGNDMVCDGDMANYQILNPTADATCTWSVPPGASFTDNGTSIDVDFTGATSGDVCVTCENQCGTTDEVCFPVTIMAPPAQPVFTSGPDQICAGQTAQYCVNPDPDATDYTWDTPQGLFTNQSNCIDLDWTGVTSGNVCVTANNNCGESPQICMTVTVNDAPTAEISGSGEFCAGSGETVDLTITLTGTAPWTITYSDGTNSFTQNNINASPYTLTTGVPGTYVLTDVMDASACPGQVSGSATVTELPLPTVQLSGSGAICAGSGQTVGLNVALTGTPNWTIQWTVNNAPQAPVNNIMTSPYTLTIGQAQAGNIEITGVTDGNGCMNSGDGNVVNVTVQDAPMVSAIATSCNATNTGYTVSFEISGGDPASYSVTSNVAGIGGTLSTTTPYIYVSDEIPNGDGYSFVVNDANNCAPVTVEDPSVECNCATKVGNMSQNLIELCGSTDSATATYNDSTEVLDADDLVEFVLHEGSGTNIVNPIAANATPTFGFQAGMVFGQTYYISAIAGSDDGTGHVDMSDPCLSVAQGTPVVFYETPTAFMIGDVAICLDKMAALSVEFTGTPPWSLSYDDGTGPQTINGINANPFTLDVTPDVTTTYTLTGVSDVHCPGEADGSVEVTVHTAVKVSNVETICNQTSTGYIVQFEITGGDPASYSVTPNSIGLSGTLSTTPPYIFTSDEIPAGFSFDWTVDDANHCGPQAVFQNSVICDCKTAVGTMVTPPLDECGDGPISAVYDTTGQVLDANDLLRFVLHTGTGLPGNILQVNTEPVFSFDPTNMTYGTTYYISPLAGNDDGTGNIVLNDPCLAYSAGTPVRFFRIPTAELSGDPAICMGSNAKLSLALTGDSPWQVLVNDDTISNIVNSPFTYTVTPDVTTTYTLQSVHDENCPGTVSGESTVTVNTPPAIANLQEICNGTNTQYTVSFEITGGDPTCYTVNGNAGTLTGNVFTSNPIPSGSGYFIEVDDCNACGPLVVEKAEVKCDCVTQAGDLSGAPLEICGNGPAMADYVGNHVLDDDDTFCFILHDGDFVPLSTNPDEPVFNFKPANMVYGQTYFICAVAGNDNGNGCVSASDPCYSISNVCSEVVFYKKPTASLTGTQSICQGDTATLEITLTGTPPFTVTWLDNNTGQNETLTTDLTTFPLMVSPAISNEYSLVSVEDAHCPGTANGVANVLVNAPPVVSAVQTQCNADNTGYTLTFSVQSVAGGITVNSPISGTLTGSTFVSDQIDIAQDYSFEVDDANGCGPVIVSGTAPQCACITQAGSMQPGLEVACENTAVTATHNGDETLDANDVLGFYLTTMPAGDYSDALAYNDQPTFDFDPDLVTTGITYYICAAAGNDDNTGSPDPADICFVTSNCTPVFWYPLPEASISGTTTVCEGDAAEIFFNMTGVAPFSLEYTLNGMPQTLLVYQGDTSLTVAPDAQQVYELVSVTSLISSDLQCQNTASGTATIDLSTPANAGMPVSDMPEFCEEEDQTVDLNTLLTGQDPNGTWTDQNNVAVSNFFNTFGRPAGDYVFTYTLTPAAPCPVVQSQVLVRINPLPVADAGTPQTLTCNNLVAALGGNSSQGNFSYEWSGGTVSDPNSEHPTTTEPGTYTLTVINNETGCSNTDMVTIAIDDSAPVPEISISDLSCFGANDGFISVGPISGGAPPYLCSINGGPFTPQTTFSDLSAGQYFIVCRDSKGCETEIPVLVEQPEELDVELTGGFNDPNDPFIQLGDSVLITVQVNLPFDSLDAVIWSPAEAIPCDTCQSFYISPFEEMTISITVQEGQCSDKDDLKIFVRKDRPIYVPNVFSPNGDGLNDHFEIFAGPGVAKIRSFLVFNRWGEIVWQFYDFNPNDPVAGWDGTHRGQTLNPAVFVWMAEVEFVDGLVELYTGDVTLTR